MDSFLNCMSQLTDRVDSGDNNKSQKQLDAARGLFTEGVDKRWLSYVNLLQHQVDQQLVAEYQQWFFEQLKGRQDWELEQKAILVFRVQAKE
ncbi:MAG: hypothetical protein ACWA5R_12705 [bacterium]